MLNGHWATIVILLVVWSGTNDASAQTSTPMHSHNDYYREGPLLEALDARARSIEVDVFPIDGQLMVAHDRHEIHPERNIERLYLQPLTERLKKGVLYPGHSAESPMILLVDFKDDGIRSLRLLNQALQPLKSWLSHLDEGRLVPGLVTIVISGKTPRDLIAGQSDRFVFVDGRLPDLQPGGLDKTVAPVVSERWSNLFKWRGVGPFPQTDLNRLKELVQQAHARGQLIRFWAAPDHYKSWEIQLTAGVDLINTDQPAVFSRWHILQTRKPLIIAHRGASGYLPEHTLPAYAMAYGIGVDYLEPDVVLSSDGELICLHDITLERVSDVEEIYPERVRADGKWYAIDFTLAELKQLRIDGPPHLYADASTHTNSTIYRLCTLREMLSMLRLMNERTGREVGVFPEPKRARFHRQNGQSLEQSLVSLLSEFGYTKREDACIIQSFEPDTLKRIRGDLGCDLRLAFLVADRSALDRVGGPKAVAGFAEILGPNRKLVSESEGQLVLESHAVGLKVVIWTLKNEPAALKRFLFQDQVDGLFADYPDVGLRVRDKQRP